MMKLIVRVNNQPVATVTSAKEALDVKRGLVSAHNALLLDTQPTIEVVPFSRTVWHGETPVAKGMGILALEERNIERKREMTSEFGQLIRQIHETIVWAHNFKSRFYGSDRTVGALERNLLKMGDIVTAARRRHEGYRY